MYTRHAVAVTEQIGEVTLVATDAAITGLYFPQHWTNPDPTTFGPVVALADDALLAAAAGQLRDYLQGERTTFDLPTKARGSRFEERVWALLAEVPYGQTTTYGALAAQLGDKSLARMVGRAVGHNPLSIVVGCHRVVGSDGKLTGYAGGLDRKSFLLGLEGRARVGSDQLF